VEKYLLFFAGLLIGITCALFWPESLSFIQHSSVKDFISTIAPAAGWLSATAAIIAISWNVWRAKYNLGIDLILKLGERFEKPEMRGIRVKAAKALIIKDPETGDPHIDDVLNFFEEIGFLLERKAIDAEAAWVYFHFWVDGYYHATSNYRRCQNHEARQTPFYDEFEQLYLTLAEIERKDMIERGRLKRCSSVEAPSEENIRDFLDGEIEMLGTPPPFKLATRRQLLK
jgi:hypothetical protein